MRKTTVALCGIFCVALIAATANAGPQLRKGGRSLEQVARPAPHRVVKETTPHRQKAHTRVTRHTVRRMPTFLQKPRIKGDLYGEHHVRRAAATRYDVTRARRGADRAQRIAEAKIQPVVNCVDGTNCGKIRDGRSQARSSHQHKIRSTLATSEERRQSYMRQVWQIRIDDRAKPQKLKELESGCNDFAACL